jgi:hypothetical protein
LYAIWLFSLARRGARHRAEIAIFRTSSLGRRGRRRYNARSERDLVLARRLHGGAPTGGKVRECRRADDAGCERAGLCYQYCNVHEQAGHFWCVREGAVRLRVQGRSRRCYGGFDIGDAVRFQVHREFVRTRIIGRERRCHSACRRRRPRL